MAAVAGLGMLKGERGERARVCTWVGVGECGKCANPLDGEFATFDKRALIASTLLSTLFLISPLHASLPLSLSLSLSLSSNIPSVCTTALPGPGRTVVGLRLAARPPGDRLSSTRDGLLGSTAAVRNCVVADMLATRPGERAMFDETLGGRVGE